jgi:lipopolysaccharide transport system permease protein
MREKFGIAAAYLYALNPLVGVIDGFRWALCGGAPPSVVELAISCAVTFAFLAVGLAYFRKVERQFADVI